MNDKQLKDWCTNFIRSYGRGSGLSNMLVNGKSSFTSQYPLYSNAENLKKIEQFLRQEYTKPDVEEPEETGPAYTKVHNPYESFDNIKNSLSDKHSY